MNRWPDLAYDDWKETIATLHRFLQVTGKVQLACSPTQNHWWNVGLHLTSMGLRSGALRRPDGQGAFDFTYDFIDHALFIRSEDGERRTIPLLPCTVKAFYERVFNELGDIGIEVAIREEPTEIAVDAIPFPEDEIHRAYDERMVRRFFHVLSSTGAVLDAFTTRFTGKVSPVLFWWGTFDLAVSRYSGRVAPRRPDADSITEEAYSHEMSSAGYWPGDPSYPNGAFYSYAAPAPEGYSKLPVTPADAFFSEQRGLFLLPYETVRDAASPERLLMDFFQSTYEAGADAGRWARHALEREHPPQPTDEPLVTLH